MGGCLVIGVNISLANTIKGTLKLSLFQIEHPIASTIISHMHVRIADNQNQYCGPFV